MPPGHPNGCRRRRCSQAITPLTPSASVSNVTASNVTVTIGADQPPIPRCSDWRSHLPPHTDPTRTPRPHVRNFGSASHDSRPITAKAPDAHRTSGQGEDVTTPRRTPDTTDRHVNQQAGSPGRIVATTDSAMPASLEEHRRRPPRETRHSRRTTTTTSMVDSTLGQHRRSRATAQHRPYPPPNARDFDEVTTSGRHHRTSTARVAAERPQKPVPLRWSTHPPPGHRTSRHHPHDRLETTRAGSFHQPRNNTESERPRHSYK